jgi:DNA-binding YbaB/EbfC family protein
MKDMGKLLKQAQMMQERLAEMQARLAEKTVEATSGGGMVKAVMNGKHEVVSLKIDPEVVNPSDVEMLEDLIVAALSEARTRVDDMIRNEMSELTGGLPIPGLF